MDINEFAEKSKNIAEKEFPDILKNHEIAFSNWWENLKNPDKEYVEALFKKHIDAANELMEAYKKSSAAALLRQNYEP